MATGRTPGAPPPGARPRVALVHDWLTGMRGGERCLEVFCELFPDADLFTLLHVPGSVSPVDRGAAASSPRSSSGCPGARRRYRHYLPLFPAAIAGSTSRGYDLVLSSSHAVAKSVRVPAGRAPRLLLLHADALRLGSLRRLLRPAGRPGHAAAHAARGGGAPPLGPAHGRRASTTSSPSRASWPTASAAPTAATPT